MAKTNDLEAAINSLADYFIGGVMKFVSDYYRDIRCDAEESKAKCEGNLSDVALFGNSYDMMTTKEMQKIINYTYTLKSYSSTSKFKRFPTMTEGRKEIVMSELQENIANLDNYFERLKEVPARVMSEAGRLSNDGNTIQWYRSKIMDSIQSITDILTSSKKESEPMPEDGIFDLQNFDEEMKERETPSRISKKDIRDLESQYLDFAVSARKAIYSRADSMRYSGAMDLQYFDPLLGKNSHFYVDIKDSKSVSDLVLDRPKRTISLLDALLMTIPEEFKGDEKTVKYEVGGRPVREGFLPGMLKEMRKQMYLDLAMMGDDYRNPSSQDAKRILSSISKFEEIYQNIKTY